jgi:hypothetical protein
MSTICKSPTLLQACFSGDMIVSSTLGYCSQHAGIGKKLVAIFALHLDYYIVTTNFSSFYINRNYCSSKITGDERIHVHLPGFAKIAP